MSKVMVKSKLFEFEAVVNLMDDEIREDIHNNLDKLHIVNDQDFVDVYCAKHKDKFSEEFILN